MKDFTARNISILLHPLFVVPLASLAYLRFRGLPLIESVQWISVWITVSVLPIAVYTYFTGEKGLNIMRKELRRPVYVLALVSLVIYYSILRFYAGPEVVVEGLLIGVFSVILFGTVNSYSKISVHTGAVTGTGTGFLTQRPFIGAVILLVGFLVGLSRIQLERHTQKEVIYGALIGILCGMLFFL